MTFVHSQLYQRRLSPVTAARLIFLIHPPSYIGRQLNLFPRNALSSGLTTTLGVNTHNVAGENV